MSSNQTFLFRSLFYTNYTINVSAIYFLLTTQATDSNMMTESRRELIKVMEKENALKNINEFLFVRVIKKRLESKTNLPNKINEVDVVTVNELLIKKLLEYRQVRNYKREEENTVKAYVETLHQKVMESKKKAFDIMNNITQKQDQLIQSYGHLEFDLQTSDIMKIKQLINEHSRLLVRFCCILDEKHKRSIKLFWRSEKRRERADYDELDTNYITYDNLQYQNKLLREKLCERKDKIQHKKNKLDAIIVELQDLKKQRKDIETHITKMIPFLEQNKEKCLQVSSGVNSNLRRKHKLSSDVTISLKKVGILKYKKCWNM